MRAKSVNGAGSDAPGGGGSAAQAPFDRDGVLALLRSPRPELYARADAVRHAHMGDDIYLRGIVEFSNICANDCI